MQIAGRGLRPGAVDNAQRHLARAAFKRGAPFAVAAVEDQNLLSVLEPQHPPEVMRLTAIKRDDGSVVKRRIDIEPRGAEIVIKA